MGKLSKDEFLKKLESIPEVKPDKWDLAMLAAVERENDTSEGITLEQVDKIIAEKKRSGKISLRVPKSLHADLASRAKDEGISLNQFILYKLAK